MNSFTLKFFDPTLEVKYVSEIEHERLNKLIPFMLLENLFLVIYQFYFLITKQNGYFPYILLPLNIFFIIMIFVLKRFAIRFLIYLLAINYLGHIILYVELIKIFSFNKLSHENSLILMIPFQIYQSTSIFCKTKWFLSSLFYSFSLVYLFFRIIQITPDQNPDFSTVIINFSSNWMIFTFIAYDHEKNSKLYFKKINESYEKINYFKFILQNMIPFPIFIIDYEKSINKFTNNFGIIKLNSKKSDPKPLGLFDKFENFLNKFSILQPNPGQNSMQFQDLSSELKNFYMNPAKQPFKANMKHKDLEKNFHTINVTSNDLMHSEEEIIPYDTFLKGPTKIYYEIKLIKVYWEDSVCLLMFFNDNTNVFRISELLNLDLYKNQLLASVSHDLKTPLNGLYGMLELSISQTSDQSLQSYLSMAKKSASFLNYLINDILDFSSMSFKKLKLNIEEVNFTEIIEQMKNLIEFQVREKKINFILSCYCQQFKQVFSDPTRIKQILLNLLSNALKFTREGSIELIVEEITQNTGSPLYKFSVKDTGIGIREDDISKLYHLFGRLENSEKINKTSVGFGLTISKKISKLLCPDVHDGLEVESIYGKGSNFFFFVSSLMGNEVEVNENFEKIDELTYLKQPSSYQTCSLFEEIKMSTNSSKFKNGIVLVVDDDLFNLLIAEQYLRLFQIKSERAMNGLEAYKLIKNDIKNKHFEICMIVMDCNMPVLDGFQASEKIQKYLVKYGRKKIPILAVTANSATANKLMCQNAGMDFFLEKPMKKNEFQKMIENILKIKINVIGVKNKL